MQHQAVYYAGQQLDDYRTLGIVVFVVIVLFAFAMIVGLLGRGK